ncbi:hypothetical protein [Vampirovibrio sp.]|uniref:hypothetical protein n=1 Tax=Vampirovibrio sp. TaxID=2717857 RepID=UPI0035932468
MTSQSPERPVPQHPEKITSSRYLLGGALLFSLLVALWVERRIFSDPAAVNDDLRNQIYWMAPITDPGLFLHDYIAQYFAQPLLISPVLSGIYHWAGPWLNPLQLSQIMPFPLVVLATFFLFQFARNFRDTTYAFWVCFAFNCSIWIFKNMAGGLSRAFIYPLLFFTLWQLIRKNWITLALGLIASALIYPPAFFLSLILLLIETIYHYGKDQDFKKRVSCLLVSFLASLGLLFWRTANAGTDPSLFGNLSTNQSTDGLRDFTLGGRIVLFPWGNFSEIWPAPLQFLGQILERVPHLYILIPTAVFLLLIGLYHRFGKARWGPLLIPAQIWRLLISSAILYALAWVFLFYFYVPERYLQYTFPLIPTFMVGTLIYQLQRYGGAKKQWPYIALALLCLILTSFFWRADLMNSKPSEKALYQYLKTTSKQSIIAASPGLASNIPLYAYRSVFISNEAYIPFHQRYFQQIKHRWKAFLLAYYATTPHVLADFAAKSGVDYIVAQSIDFSEPRLSELPDRYYYAFEPAFFNRLKRPKPSDYLLNQAPKACIPFVSKGIKVIQVQCLLTYLKQG